ncbi:MAG: hypothetical protein KAJ18_00420 [Candidatus Omnitrophica bacterium]|nr:hypothetical protein [Candidatus Omnitrophota bacterium]
MNGKKSLMVFVVGAFLVFGFCQQGFARGGVYGYHGKNRAGQGTGLIEKKLFHEMMFVFSHQEELGILGEQLTTIRQLKISIKKDLIKKNADIGIVEVDIKAALWEDKIDVEAVNKLIDQQYEFKKEKKKALAKALADLKAILTDDQLDKMESLMKEKMSREKGGR